MSKIAWPAYVSLRRVKCMVAWLNGERKFGWKSEGGDQKSEIGGRPARARDFVSPEVE